MAAPWASGALVRLRGRLHGQDCINTFHLATNTVVNDSAALAALLVQVAQAMIECAIQNLLPGATSDYQLISADARQIHPTISDPVEVLAPANSVGQRGATSVSFAASLVNWRSTRGGRRGHGKTFFPPPGEADIANSLLNAGTVGNIADMVACILEKFELQGHTTDWVIGVFSATINKQQVGGGFDNAFAPITQGTPSDKVAIMSNRKVGIGS